MIRLIACGVLLQALRPDGQFRQPGREGEECSVLFPCYPSKLLRGT
jgi:hypothetical protein